MGSTRGLGKQFGRLWSASTLSQFGGGIHGAALPLLAASLTSSPAMVAAAAAAVELPWLVFGLPAGAIVDRVDSRRLAAWAGVANALLVAILAAMVALDRASLPLLLSIAFACGTCGTLGSTAVTTMTPKLVGHQQLDRANSRLVTAGSAGSELIGPPLGGYLFGLVAAIPFAVNAGTAALAAALVFSLPSVFRDATVESVGARPRRLWRDITDGARWLARHRRLRAVTVLSVVFLLTDSAWFALMVLYIRDILHLPASAYGVLLGIGAIGGLAGGFSAARISRTVGSTGVLLASLLLSAAAAQAVLGLTSHTILTVLMLSVSSFAFGVWNVVTTTLRQKLSPSDLLGRVTSANQTAILSASPLGALLGGLAANALGLRAPFLLGVPLLVLGAAYGYVALRR
ncbi:MFS transporter [Actinopolymorpha sp. B17G11]|uniref:MFS transporter n=1 Tax=Actinopolymorpha sp. B17G11 TaxID=3160861 RepID=UPI0032E51DE3